ncbi:helix-turn-helix domain-containing protein [Saccharopolyspora sp. NPDC002376]
MPPTPTTDEERARVRRLHAQGKTRNDIAREIGRSPSTVSKIARELGLTFDRSKTAAATHAKQVDNKTRRAELSAELLRRAGELLAQIDRPHIVYAFGGPENVYNEHQLDKPPTSDIRNLMQSASIALQRHADLERIDSGSQAEDARSMLGSLAAGLQAAYDQLPPADADDRP